MGFTTAGVNSALNALLGDLFGITVPGFFCVGALLKVPDGEGSAESGIEPPMSSGYDRVNVDNTTANWPDAVGGVKTNANSIIFPKATADWGVVVGWSLCLYTNPTLYPLANDQLFCWGFLNEPRVVPALTRLRFAPGELHPFVFPFSN